jgi:hypothetical protein
MLLTKPEPLARSSALILALTQEAAQMNAHAQAFHQSSDSEACHSTDSEAAQMNTPFLKHVCHSTDADEHSIPEACVS